MDAGRTLGGGCGEGWEGGWGDAGRRLLEAAGRCDAGREAGRMLLEAAGEVDFGAEIGGFSMGFAKIWRMLAGRLGGCCWRLLVRSIFGAEIGGFSTGRLQKPINQKSEPMRTDANG